jgi:hypothetical protein
MKLTRSRLRRWHVWLGWIIALPILFWVTSGLVMVWKPIEEVRGEDLLREPLPVRLVGPPVPPSIGGVPVESLALQQRAAGPRWVLTLPDGTKRLADPLTGRLVPPLSAPEAVHEVQSRYTGKARVRSVSRTDPKNPPLELRRPIAAWQVAMDDDTRFYVDSSSGDVVARRTSWWRFYDLMWGLHIMDLKTREHANNWFTLGFGGVALLMSLLALVLLPMTINRRRRRPIRQDR